MKPLTTAEFMENLDEYAVDYSKKRTIKGWDANYEEAKRAKAWLMQNHREIEKKYGIPEGTLVALAAHESRFDPYARSFSGAQGMFQFTGRTGKHYGLQIGEGVDERLDYRKSADAAARYVAEELKRRGNISLALAQWNGGGMAAKAVKDGTVESYVSPNGTVGETHGFLQGLRDSARKYGFNHIADDIETNVYGQKKKPALKADPATLYPAMSGKQAVPKAATLYDEVWRRSEMKANAKPVPLAVTQLSFRAEEPKNQAPYDLMPLYNNLAENYKIFRSGGSLLQLSDDRKIESILKGEERIYSRADTKRLVDLAKKAKDKTTEFLLGKFFYDATKKQDSRPPEYVED